LGLFGYGNPFHNDELVDSDNLITRDEMGENPGFNELGPTEVAPIAGDTSDDDGQALDDAFTPNPQGILGADVNDTVDSDDVPGPDAPPATRPNRAVATPFGHTVELTDQDKPEDVADETTRILQARVLLTGNDPQMLFPRDPNRKHLWFVGDDDFQIGSSKSECYAAGLWPAGLGVVLDEHTGALWVYNTTAASGSYVKAWAVTS
jgi:hypothetical protein